MADTTTTNYGLTKPEVGASEDTWGTKVNTDMDLVDAQMKVNANTAAAALPKAGGIMTGDTLHGDNVKAKFGTAPDLEIYHDGSHSIISDIGAGGLKVKASDVYIRSTSDADMIHGTSGGHVKLYNNGSEKLATTSTGINVTGTVTADGLVVDGVSTLNNHVKIANGYSLGWGDISTRVTGNATADTIQVYTDAKKRANIAANGDISFYEDTGTTAKFFWDASAESLGIGTSSPAYPLEVQSGGVGTVLRAGTTNVSIDSTGSAASPSLIFNGDSDSGLWHPTSNTLAVSTAGSERMRVDATGNVLVGKSASNTSVAGSEFRSNGFAASTRSNDVVYSLNRLSSDGSILQFEKDGSTVGSIGTVSSKLFIGNGNANLLFANATDDVVPSTGTGATNDNSIDLGAAGNRFKDLYLSGQVNAGTLVTTGPASVTSFTGTTALGMVTRGSTGATDYSGIDFRGNNQTSAVARIAVLTTGGGSKLQFGTSNVYGSGITNTAMTIDPTGNVLVGTTTAYGRLAVEAPSTGIAMGFQRSVATYGTAANVGSITCDGSSTAYNTSSDYRLKTDVQPMTGATATFMQLKPCNFEWIADGTRVDGFLAHELGEVIPAAATGTHNGMMDEEYQATAATGDIYTAAIAEVATESQVMETVETGSYVNLAGETIVETTEQGVTTDLVETVVQRQDVDGVSTEVEVEVTTKVPTMETVITIPAVAEVIHSADVEHPETLEDGQAWRETTAQVMATRSVPDMQGIDQSKIVPLLTATIQELIARIEALEAV